MAREVECQICNTIAKEHPNNGADVFIIDCPRCGHYEIDGTSSAYFLHNDDELKSVKLSHYIRKNFNGKNRIKINRIKVKDLIENFELPKPKEQADNLLFWIGEDLKTPDGMTEVLLNDLISIIGAQNEKGVEYIANYLKDEGYIHHLGFATVSQGHSPMPIHSQLKAFMTFKGWDRYYEILNESVESKIVFMAMKFGKDETDNLYKNVLIDAVKQTGFELRRLDDNPQAGSIDDRLRVEIRRSKFLISDLTHDNPGAYFEAGFAEGLGKKVIYICEKEIFDERGTHFDTNHHLTLKWDLSKPEEFAEQLKATIRATFPNEAKMED